MGPAKYLLCCILVSAVTGTIVEDFQKRIETDPQDAPTFPVTLTYAWDGPLRPVIDPDLFWTYNHLADRTTVTEIIEEGRRAVDYLELLYGIDLSGVSDNVLLGRGNYTSYDGSVTFAGAVTDSDVFFRLVSLSGPDFAIKYNNAIGFGYYFVLFNQGWGSSGIVTGKIPSGTLGLYGTYIIPVEDSIEKGVGLAPPLGPILRISFRSRTAFYPAHPINGVTILDCIVEHELLGKGTAIGGMYPMLEDVADRDENTFLNGKTVLSFPGALYNPQSSTFAMVKKLEKYPL